METHKKVIFQNKEYWLHGWNLSPLDHYDETGELLANPFRDISYAVIYEGNIMRLGEIIGKQSDLIEVK